MKVKITTVTENKQILNNIFRLSAVFESHIKPGQFFMLKTLDNSFLLPRPISVNDVNGRRGNEKNQLLASKR